MNPLVDRRNFLALAAGLGASLIAGCATTSGRAQSAPGSDGANPSATALQEVRGDGVRLAAASADQTAANACRFAAELFAAAVPGTANAVISPYSVFVALGMAALGADGAVLEAMTTVLGGDPKAVAGQVTAIDAAVAAAIETGTRATNTDGGQEPPVFSPANSLFVQQGTALRQEFLDAVATGYGAGLFTTDFSSNAESAREQINQWVSDKTNELIPEFIKQGVIDPSTRLLLVNALYLKAQWAKEFDRNTGTQSFSTPDNKTVQYDALTTGLVSWGYATGEGWQSVQIPYRGGDLAMTILLPDEGKFAAVAEKLDGTTLLASLDGKDTDVEVTMPPFKTDTPVNLTDPLTAMGLGPAFGTPMPLLTEPSDLSALAMSDVIHQARIEVNEFGTEAAAATGVAFAGAAPGEPDPPKPIIFTVDRPFLYVIHDVTTKAPLFLGRVTDPTA